MKAHYRKPVCRGRPMVRPMVTATVALIAALVATTITTTQAAAEEGRPADSGVLAVAGKGLDELDPADADPCGCLWRLRACLRPGAPTPRYWPRAAPRAARPTLSRVEPRLDALACVERAGNCQLTCRR